MQLYYYATQNNQILIDLHHQQQDQSRIPQALLQICNHQIYERHNTGNQTLNIKSIYYFYSFENNDHLVVLEAYKIVSVQEDLDNLRNPKILHYITKSRLELIENHIANYRCHISSRAHYLYTYLQEDKQNLANCTYCLRNIYKFKLNFFVGMFEFIVENPIYGQQVIEFIHLVLNKHTSNQILNEAIKILCFIFLNSNNSRLSVIQALIWIADLSDIVNKFNLLTDLFMTDTMKKMEIREIIQQLSDFKVKFQSDQSLNNECGVYQQIICPKDECDKKNQCYWDYIEQINEIIST